MLRHMFAKPAMMRAGGLNEMASTLNPGNRHALYEARGYSAAVRSNDLLFVSGQELSISSLTSYSSLNTIQGTDRGG
jgi:enamine deaminase RidA (YjgF/YER057c/UK114 family)